MATRKLLKRGDRVIYTKLTPYENYGHGLNAYDETSLSSVFCLMLKLMVLLHPAWCL